MQPGSITHPLSLVRSGCFSSPYFHGCMESLLVDKDTKGKAGGKDKNINKSILFIVGYLRARFGNTEFGFDPLA